MAEGGNVLDEARALVSRIDSVLANAPFVSGDRYTLADTFATPALARFRVHGFDTWWSDGSNANVANYGAFGFQTPVKWEDVGWMS